MHCKKINIKIIREQGVSYFVKKKVLIKNEIKIKIRIERIAECSEKIAMWKKSDTKTNKIARYQIISQNHISLKQHHIMLSFVI